MVEKTAVNKKNSYLTYDMSCRVMLFSSFLENKVFFLL